MMIRIFLVPLCLALPAFSQHRMLVSAPELELLAGTREVLVPATHLVNGRDITVRPGGWVSYYHFMFDRHELVWANGVPAESMRNWADPALRSSSR